MHDIVVWSLWGWRVNNKCVTIITPHNREHSVAGNNNFPELPTLRWNKSENKLCKEVCCTANRQCAPVQECECVRTLSNLINGAMANEHFPWGKIQLIKVKMNAKGARLTDEWKLMVLHFI